MKKDIKTIIAFFAIGLLFLGIAGYAYSRTRNVIAGVSITLPDIEDGQTFTDPVVEMKGRAKNAVKVLLNDREIGVDKDGNFDELLLLLPGYNIITLEAEDRFGKKIEKNYHVYLKQNPYEIETPTIPETPDTPPPTIPLPQDQDTNQIIIH